MDKKLPLPSPCFLNKIKNKENSLNPLSSSLKNCLMPGLVSTGYVQSKLKSNDQFRQPALPTESNAVRAQKAGAPHFSSPQGMLMPSCMQPPPMYGPRGPTIPPKYMNSEKSFEIHKKLWCEICDKEFPSKSDLEGHRTEHKICGIDGCCFSGDAPVLLNHIENTHSSGLYNRIRKLSTPEEIAKWREERRKRYPTRSNIELRQKAQEERMKRGEKIEKKKNRFGEKHDRRPIRNNEQSKQKAVGRRPEEKNSNIRKKYERKQREEPRVSEALVPDFEGEELCKGKLRRFNGTSALKDYTRPKTTSPKLHPLASLLSMYESDEESDSISENEDLSSQSNKNDKSPACGDDLHVVGGNEETCISKAANGPGTIHVDSSISNKNANAEEITGKIDIRTMVDPCRETVRQNDFARKKGDTIERESEIQRSNASNGNDGESAAEKSSPRDVEGNEETLLKASYTDSPQSSNLIKSVAQKNTSTCKGVEVPEERHIQELIQFCEKAEPRNDISAKQSDFCIFEKTSEIQTRKAEGFPEQNKASSENCDRSSRRIIVENEEGISDSNDEMPEEIPIQKEVEPSRESVQLIDSPGQPNNIRNIEKISEIRQDEHEKSKPSTSENIRVGKHRKRFRRRKNKGTEPEPEPEPIQKKQKTSLLDYSKLRKRRQNTMLEKLLEPDIVHERNVLLQCVRFVVENDFFGIGSKKCT